MSEVQIYRRALERIAKLNCRSLEEYVRKADEIAVDALVFGENVDQGVVENDKVPRSLRRAA
jgi:uncharacterized protein (UPF0147 family)